jgi:DNA-directed RNA polymerase specialized sigma24 family protein
MAAEEIAGSDEEMVEATLPGDEPAFAALAQKYKNLVFGLAFRFAGEPAELAGICQKIFIQDSLQLRHSRRGRHPAGHTYHESLLEVGHEESGPLHPAPRPHLERLDTALDQLSIRERLVIALLELENGFIQEVVDLTGWSPVKI